MSRSNSFELMFQQLSARLVGQDPATLRGRGRDREFHIIPHNKQENIKETSTVHVHGGVNGFNTNGVAEKMSFFPWESLIYIMHK
ncbi:hypothetical protein QQP08_022377 [Theobroma cacao]|nr:hypothetical protein QQP08_022377 [Theobroma cacao]